MQWFFFKEEFFKPAEVLLDLAPMIYIRGNHESCTKMGIAWQLFFSPQKYQNECVEKSPAYKINFSNLNFLIMDTAKIAIGQNYSKEKLDQLKQEFMEAKKQLNGPDWLLTHRPIIGVNKLNEQEIFPRFLNFFMLSEAFGNDLTISFPLAISGHLHTSAYLQRDKDKFNQFIVGNSGATLLKANNKIYNYKGSTKHGIVGIDYGYMIFEKYDNYWKVISYNLESKEISLHVINYFSFLRPDFVRVL